MRISRNILKKIKPTIELQIPKPDSFQLPEKVLQFGTGVLLRGLPDYFIDQANKQGIFNGRIVMVKSTDNGSTAAFEHQDGCFTLCIRGLSNGEKQTQYILNNAISRVLSAKPAWDEVLQCAANEEMQIILSNTTEVGIQLTDDDIFASPPTSFPGKLLAFLWARYQAFQGDPNSGMVIIPTELITDNGNKLKNILLTLAQQNGLSEPFIKWLDERNTFCNSLVDRIVPGRFPEAEHQALEKLLGYEDDLMISAEPYRLWAIETTDPDIHQKLSFSTTDPGIILTNNITKHRELKLRLLNGPHTFCCGLAHLKGFETVKEAMDNEDMSHFIEDLMLKEISPAIVGEDISLEETHRFAKAVIDRFRNPYINHPWLSIAMQYTSKMRMRDVPILLSHYRKTSELPVMMCTGLAAYILFMRSEEIRDGVYQGSCGGQSYPIQDDAAAILHNYWKKYPDDPSYAILSDAGLWGLDLTSLPGLKEAISIQLKTWLQDQALA